MHPLKRLLGSNSTSRNLSKKNKQEDVNTYKAKYWELEYMATRDLIR